MIMIHMYIYIHYLLPSNIDRSHWGYPEEPWHQPIINPGDLQRKLTNYIL
jgi:hypothetical protein